MPAERRFGMDHEHYDWSPLTKRGALRWPDNARVALCAIVNLERMELSPPEDSYTTGFGGGLGPRPYPDHTRLTHREYGHRVGIFRVLDVLEKHGIKATVAMDVLTAENYPYLVKHCQSRGCEIIGHGISVSQVISSNMSEEQERGYIRTCQEALRRATGSTPVGWFGGEYGESARTPQLLAEAGIRYLCDWPNDEQPYPMKVPKGEIFSLPILWELDDLNALWNRRLRIDRYGELLKEGFDTIYEDAARTGMVMVLHLHPWLIGQPFRIGYLDDALGHMMHRQGVWAATGSEIIDWYRSNPPVA